MKNILDIGKEEMFKAIRELYDEYRLPKLNIATNEWHAFFDVTSSHFDSSEMADSYPIALNIMIRRALNYALVDASSELTINYLIDSLKDLTVFHFFSDEIALMQDEIKKQIDFSNSKKYIKK